MDCCIKKRVEHRLKIIGGQIKGLEKMVEEECYCPNIINQSLAIREALVSVEKLMLENHLVTHIAEKFEKGDKDSAVKEVLSLYQFPKVN